MGYGQIRGRKPFERASKIAHTHILNNPEVQHFVQSCTLPDAPGKAHLESLQKPLPNSPNRIEHVIAVDGGMTEVSVRKDFPNASITFMIFGPLTLSLKDLGELDVTPFLGPEDMARLKNLQRYSLSVPSKAVLGPDAKTFSEGVRSSIHAFLANPKRPELLNALKWLLFRGWLPEKERTSWDIPRCPSDCDSNGPTFAWDGPDQKH